MSWTFVVKDTGTTTLTALAVTDLTAGATLEDEEWSLLNASSDMVTKAVGLVLAAVLNNSGSDALARLTPYLPGNAGDVAIYDFWARGFAGPGFAVLVVEPHGLARLWQIGKEKLRLWPFPH